MLLNSVGEDALYKTWSKYGMYESSKKLFEIVGWYPSPYVIRYLSNKFNWVRVITDKDLPIYKGVLRNRVLPEYYKHLQFK